MSDEHDLHCSLSDAAEEGRLLALLKTWPQERLLQPGPHGTPLLHYACGDVAATIVLLAGGLDVNARTTTTGWSALHCAAINGHPRVVEVLCAAGADVHAGDSTGATPLDFALLASPPDLCARVLLANGARLSTARHDVRRRVKPELEAFERGVLACRAAALAMLSVKRAGRLVYLDKYLLRELAVSVWTTRWAKEWAQ